MQPVRPSNPITNSIYLPKSLINRISTGKREQDAEKYASSFKPIAAKGGGSFPGAIYEKNGKQWLGKPGYFFDDYNFYPLATSQSLPPESLPNRKSMLNSVLEKIASDIYGLISRGLFYVPKTRVIKLPWENAYTIDDGLLKDLIMRINEIRPEDKQLDQGLHLFSKFVPGFRKFEEATVTHGDAELGMRDYIAKTGCLPEEIKVDGKAMRLTGLMEVLAISKIIHDIDVLGEDIDNIGFVIKPNESGNSYAQVVKIDPGCAFNHENNNLFLNTQMVRKNTTLPLVRLIQLNNAKDIQFASSSKSTISWEKLSSRQKIDFLTALEYGMHLLSNETVLDFMIFRQGQFNIFGKVLSLKSNYALEVFELILDNIQALREVYANDLKKIPNEFDAKAYSNNNLANDSNYIEIKPGSFAKYAFIKKALENWVETDKRDNREKKVRAKEAILECYRKERTSLNLSDYGLNSLPDDVFEYLDNLREIDLSNNCLLILPYGINRLSQVQLVNLKGNPIRNFKDLHKKLSHPNPKVLLSPQQEFGYFKAVVEAWENEGNCLITETPYRKIAKESLIKCQQKRSQELALANLSSIPAEAFRYLPNLKKLDLRSKISSVISNLSNLPLNIKLELTPEQGLSFLTNNLNAWINDCPPGERKAREFATSRIMECYKTRDIELDLSGLNLSFIPEGILSHLTNLKELNLSCNKLNKLPDDIGRLDNLASLNASVNLLSNLPEGINLLTKLNHLNLAANKLQNIPEDISKLKNLVELYLSNNRIIELPETIGLLNKLVVLSLNNNNLQKLPVSISQLVSLQKLSLTDNQLKDLPDTIGMLRNLIEFDLFNNRLISIPKSIGNLSNLKLLRLSKNQLEKLPEEIKLLKSLESLGLRENNFSQFPDCIYNLSSLKRLNIYGNKINKLAEDIGNLVQLEELEIGENPIQELPVNISKLDKLKNNPFKSLNVQGIPEGLAVQQKFSYLCCILNVWINQNCPAKEKQYRIDAKARILNCYQQNAKKLDLSGLKLTSLPEEMFNFLPSLEKLNLAANSLKRIPTDVQLLDNLLSLNIADNQLDNVPEGIINLEKLKKLNLSNNKLTKLTDSIWQLKNLEILRLSGNKLQTIQTTIKEIGKLSLSELDLADNELSELPAIVGKLATLEVLNLDRNKLDNLPNEISKLKNLKKLDLSHNKFTLFPNVVTQFTNLVELSISYNELKELPDILCKLAKLEYLALEGNKLNQLPKDIYKLANLKGLNLTYNKISRLLDNLCQLSKLERLDLDGNPLTELPSTINKLNNLKNNPFHGIDFQFNTISPNSQQALLYIDCSLMVWINGNAYEDAEKKSKIKIKDGILKHYQETGELNLSKLGLDALP